MDIHLFKLL